MIIYFILLLLISSCHSYSNGAGSPACNSPYNPSGHSSPVPITAPSSFFISTSSSSYTAGNTITVTINSGSTFKGILLFSFAQSGVSSGTSLGSWNTIPSGYQRSCSNKAITHSNSNSKSSGLSFIWTAPLTSGSGSVTFQATIVLSTSTSYKISTTITEQLIVPPSQPRTLTGTPGLTNITLSWIAPSSSGSSTITGYNVQQLISGSYSTITTTTSLSHVVTGLASDTSYSFQIIATSSAGDSSASTSLIVSTLTLLPSVPVGFTSTVWTNVSITLKWNVPLSSGIAALQGFNISQLIGGSYQPIAIVSETTLNYNVTGLTASTLYSFKIVSFTSMGESTTVQYTITTASSNPIITGVSAASVSSNTLTTVTFIWNAPDLSGWPLRSVIFTYITGSSFYSVTLTGDLSDCLNYTATDLTISGNVTFSTTLQYFSTAANSAVASSTLLVVAACPNSCSNHGSCLSSMCRCSDGWLSPDCSIPAVFKNLQLAPNLWLSGATSSNKLYFRFISSTSAYFALGWSVNSNDGMSGGDMAVVRGLTVEDRYSSTQSTPDLDSQQDFTDINVWVDSAGKTIATWSRLLVSTDLSQDKPIVTGQMQCSWAIGDSQIFSQHSSSNRGKFQLDFFTGGFSYANTALAAVVFLAAFLIVCFFSWMIFNNASTKNFSEWIYYSRFKLPFFDEDSVFDNWCLDIIPTLQGLTIGEMLLLVTYFISLIIYLALSSVAFRMAQIDFVNVLGDLSSIHMGIALLPVVRNSIWLHIFGISWDRALKWHRMAAKLTLLFVLLHGSISLSSVPSSVYVSELLTVLSLSHNSNYGFGAFIILCFIFITTLDYVRRTQFELFYFSHFFVFGAILLAILHQALTLYCVIAPLILYVIDLLYRLNRYLNKAKITKLTKLESGVVRVDITAKGLNWEPGNFIFINIPEIAYFEWHPFTISGHQHNTSSREHFSLHVKAAPSLNSFTNILRQSNPSEIFIEGPYGNNSLLFESNYESLVFCVGGVGCTPAMSILQHLYAMHLQNRLPYKTVKLVWVVSDEAPILSWFPELLTDLQSASENFQLDLYVTNKKSRNILTSITTELVDLPVISHEMTPINASSLKVLITRPNFKNLFNRFNHPGHKTAVFSCGPLKMMADVREVCKMYNHHLHEETFIL